MSRLDKDDDKTKPDEINPPSHPEHQPAQPLKAVGPQPNELKAASLESRRPMEDGRDD